MAFKKATRKQAKLRAAVSGPSGSGKTYTCLRIATGLRKEGESIAVIDSEKGSASKYGGDFDFDVSEINDCSVNAIMAEIDEAAKAGYKILIIDSLTHTWQWVKEEVDRYARARCNGNSYMAWAHGTPLWNSVLQAILDYPGHVLITMRSKTEYVLEEYESNGRKKTMPVKVGMAPEARNGTEYEFDVQLELTYDHLATVTKDRTNTIDGQTFDKPGEELGQRLLEWLESGDKPLEQIQKECFLEFLSDMREAETMSELAEIYTASRKEGFPATWVKQLNKIKDQCKAKLQGQAEKEQAEKEQAEKEQA